MNVPDRDSNRLCNQQTSPAPVRERAGGGLPTTARTLTSEALFAGATEIEIVHAGARYRLRKTALGKLILTK